MHGAANQALYVNLIGTRERQGRWTIDMKLDRAVLSARGKNATHTNNVLNREEVLRPKKADTVTEIENRLNEWKEKQTYLEGWRGAAQ